MAERVRLRAATEATRELLGDGESALLVPPNDPAALAAAIGRLAGNEALRRSIAERGRALFLERASRPVLGRRWVELMRSAG